MAALTFLPGTRRLLSLPKVQWRLAIHVRLVFAPCLGTCYGQVGMVQFCSWEDDQPHQDHAEVLF